MLFDSTITLSYPWRKHRNVKKEKTLTDIEPNPDNLASEPVFVMTSLAPHASCLLSLKQARYQCIDFEDRKTYSKIGRKVEFLQGWKLGPGVGGVYGGVVKNKEKG